jgi:hypothetical protein
MPKSRAKSKNRVVIPYKPLWFHISLGFAAFFALGSIALLCAVIWTGRTDTARGKPIVPTLLLSVLAGAGFGSAAFYYGIMKPRLVFDDDFLQLRVGMAKGTVRGQIPIGNIASAELTKIVTVVKGGINSGEKISFVVDVLPLRRRDEETWWPGFGGGKGEAIRIMDEYIRAPSIIRGRILKRVEQHREAVRSQRREA